MATTQLPIEGVFERETGKFIGVTDENGGEISIPTMTSAQAAAAAASGVQGLPAAVMSEAEVAGARGISYGNAYRRLRSSGAALRRDGGAPTESNTSTTTVLTLADVKRIPANISGFRLGWEFISSTQFPPISLVKYAVLGSAGNTPTQAMDAAAGFHLSPSITPVTFNSASGITPGARRSQNRPTPIVWSDFMPCVASAGQTLATRMLVPYPGSAWKFTYSPIGIASNSAYLAAINDPAMWNSATWDTVTTPGDWGINASNMQRGSVIPYVQWFFTDDVRTDSVWQFGDSTSLGTTTDGTTDAVIPPVVQACQAINLANGFAIQPVTAAIGGTSTWDHWTRFEDMLADSTYSKPSAVVWLVGSQNNFSTQSTSAIAKGILLQVERKCAEIGARLILQTAPPFNTSNTSTDGERKSLNDFARAMAQSGRAVIADWDAVLSNGATPARYKSQYGSSSHPVAQAYADYLTQQLLPAIKTSLSIL